MPLSLATTIVHALTGYVLAGVMFAVFFALRGAARLDPLARDGTWGFRLLLLPGAMMLWPVLGYRILRSRRAPS